MFQLPRHPLSIPRDELRDEACRGLRRIGYLFLLALLFMGLTWMRFTQAHPLPSATAPAPPRLFLFTRSIVPGIILLIAASALLCARGIKRRSRGWLAYGVGFTFLFTAMFLIESISFCFSPKIPHSQLPTLLIGIAVVSYYSARYHFMLVRLQRQEKGERIARK